jgi:hypothetical protein
MVTVPAATPVTTPVVDTVAIAVFEEVQVPPIVAFVSVVVEPAHTVLLPAID